MNVNKINSYHYEITVAGQTYSTHYDEYMEVWHCSKDNYVKEYLLIDDIIEELENESV